MSKNTLKATHEGILKIDNMELNVAVLNDDTRIITQAAVFKALNRPKRGTERVIGIPTFMDAKNLQPFISSDLENVINKIEYFDLNNKIQYGFNAIILPLVSDLYLKAREAGVIKQPAQFETAQKAEILVRSLAKIGITALVDEATGYQYDREKDELQKILKAYISEELLPWQKTFPDIFYKELFRLNGWDFTVNGIKKRPGVIGTWTKKLIYERLPKGVLEELEKSTPTSASGNKTARLHQSLTPDIGNPSLMALIYTTIGLLQATDNMKNVWYQIKKIKSREDGQLELPFEFDEQGHTIEPVESSIISNHSHVLKQSLHNNQNDEKPKQGKLDIF